MKYSKLNIMMKRMQYYIIMILSLAFVFNACSPVRSSTYKGKDKNKSSKSKSNNSSSKNEDGANAFGSDSGVYTDEGTKKAKGIEDNASGDDINSSDMMSKNAKHNAASEFAAQRAKEQQKADELSARYSDTLLIKLPPVLPPAKAKSIDFEDNGFRFDANSQFDKAVSMFDNEEYEKACTQFQFFIETMKPQDSLHNEAVYYRSECYITDNDLPAAELLLVNLLKVKTLAKTTRERALVRLGQIYCVLKKEKKAMEYFTLFKKEFPKSIYKDVANCEAVK